jgi:T5SS/PEP-CTERM-associated repeat protein
MMQVGVISLGVFAVVFSFGAMPAIAGVAWSGDVEPTIDPSTWTLSTTAYIGKTSSGTLNVTGGGVINSGVGYIGYSSGSTGVATIDGAGSTWINNSLLYVGWMGSGVLNITGGGAVSSLWGYIADISGSTGVITVDGVGSTWTAVFDLEVGRTGTLNITNGGLVSVADTLTIDYIGGGDGFINMSTGGMLAVNGDADDSLAEFLGLVLGTDAIHYWDYPLGNWADIAGATPGEDYTLTYLTEGDLSGYTMLTVLEQTLLEGDANYDGVVSAGDYAKVQANFGNTGVPGIHGDANGDGVVSAGDYASVQANFGNTAPAQITPEPATMGLLVIGGLALLKRRRK